LGAVFLGARDDGDAGSFSGEAQGNGPAEPASGAGDEGDLIGESHVFGV
jgi:hypothetical protein